MNSESGALRSLLHAKIHKATVTHADVNYIGSITIDLDLLERVDLWPGEQVMVVSNTTGARLETYVIAGERGSGIIAMNGAAAHTIHVGEEVIIMAFKLSQEPIAARSILVDRDNRYLSEI